MATANRSLGEAWKVYNSACKSIEAAVVLEENHGSVQEALKHYKTAITALDRALTSPAVKGSNSQDMIEVRSKMKKYRDLAAERCVVLTKPQTSSAPVTTRKILPPAAQRSNSEAKSTAFEKLKKYDQALVGKILDDVLTDCSQVSFDDIGTHIPLLPSIAL
uniref:MIT (Microtubule interacting and transport) domain n=1 Tax=Schistocephalus solidus TaxID=70667 RepID=A0A0X3PU40_SCHSO